MKLIVWVLHTGSLAYRNPPIKGTFDVCVKYWDESHFVYETHLDVTSAQTDVHSDDITLYTHLHLDRLRMLHGLIERWPGL